MQINKNTSNNYMEISKTINITSQRSNKNEVAKNNKDNLQTGTTNKNKVLINTNNTDLAKTSRQAASLHNLNAPQVCGSAVMSKEMLAAFSTSACFSAGEATSCPFTDTPLTY